MLLDRLPELGGTVACPNDSGARDIVALTYTNHASATVDAHLGGCGAVTNGWFGRISTANLRSALAARIGASA
jgi:hypothetical protein